MTEGSFEGVGGLKIFTREWLPAGKPHAVVVISHGINSHSGRYTWVAEQFVSKGLAVYALDHRGRGRSEGERFFVEKVEDYADDLATFIGMVRVREPGLPVFLLGHNAGGVVACLYALEHQSEITGLICESFAHEVPAPDFALADFSRITLPVLILHGTSDRATKPSGSRRFYEKAGSNDKMLKLYEGHYHDLLADVGKQQVMVDIQNWIDAHLGTNAPRAIREQPARA